MRDFFEAKPGFFAPAWQFSLGFVVGFYPAFVDPAFRAALAACGLALGVALIARGLRGLRLILLVAASLGAGAGVAMSLVEAGLSSPAWPTGATTDPSSASRPEFGRPPSLSVVGLAGRLASDSRPARGGLRSMDLEVDRVFVSAPGIEGSYAAQGSARLLVREGWPVASGASIEVRGQVGSAGTSVFFADRRDFLVRDEGGIPARLRNGMHEAFLGALLRAVGVDRGAEAARVAPEKDDAAGLLLALLAGWQDELSPADAAAFRGAGCTHILALSGQHLSIIAMGLLFILRPLIGPLRALLPSLFVVAFYVFIVGPGPSLLRAIVSFAIVSIATLSDRPQDGRSTLALCFIVHAFLFPGQLREAGLELSYLAVLGLVVLAPRFAYLVSSFVPPRFTAVLSASLAAQTATAPWIVLVFGVFQPVGVLATILTALLVEAVMIGGLCAAIIVAILPPAVLVTAPIELFLLRLLERAMGFFAGIPSLSIGEGPGRSIAAALMVLFALLLYALPHVESLACARRSGAAGTLACPPRI